MTEDNGRVRMTHPDLKDQEIFVLPHGVPVHELAGWKTDKQPAKSTAGNEKKD